MQTVLVCVYSRSTLDLLYDLLSGSQRPKWGTIPRHVLAQFSDRHLWSQVRIGFILHLHLSNVNLDDRPCGLGNPSSLPCSSSPSPAKNLLDQTQDDRYSNRGEKGCVNSELMFIRLSSQLTLVHNEKHLRNTAGPSSRDRRMLCSLIRLHLSRE